MAKNLSFNRFLATFLSFYCQSREYDHETITAFTFLGGMRNISAGTVIALSYFPSAVVLPVVVGMLFQQILASLFATFLDKVFSHYHRKVKSVKA